MTAPALQIRAVLAAHIAPDAVRASVLATVIAARQESHNHARALLQVRQDGWRAARTLSACHDEIVQVLYAHIMPEAQNGLCLAAIGGYGRGELAPFSDLDLLFIHDGPVSEAQEERISQFLYILWDAGMTVGHAVRSVDECVTWACADTTIDTALLDMRVLCGDAALAQRAQKKRRALFGKRTDTAFVAAKLAERDHRHARQGESRYMTEPHVKNGKGGLRDLQTLVWIAQRLNPQEKNGMRALGKILSDAEMRRVKRNLRFMWTVRFWLHLSAGRAEERLGFDLQQSIASAMGYRNTPSVERLMKAYFLKTRDIGSLTRVFCARLEGQTAKPAPVGLSRFLPWRRRVLRSGDFIIEAGRLHFAHPHALADTPSLLMDLFAAASSANADIHPDALTMVQENLFLVTRAFRKDHGVAAAFYHCLCARRSSETILRLMSDSGLLGRYIPEFGRIVAQTQFNMYHRYTVDEHTLRAVGIVSTLCNPRRTGKLAWLAPIARAANNLRALHLAMLLHDTGKGDGDQQISGAKAAQRACARLGLDAPERRLVAWLVGHHLLMSDTAQTRDLSDPQTILDFARTVQSPERLRLLLLLTIADIKAVGEDVWNSWKERLIRELYEATEALFRGRVGGELKSLRQQATTRVQNAKAAFAKTCSDADFAQRWQAMLGDSYWTSFPQKTMQEQAQWVRTLHKKGASYGVYTSVLAEDSSTALRVYAIDSEGLFAHLAKAVCLAGGNITSARIFTTRDGHVLDVFYIQNRQGRPFGAQNSRALARLEMLARTVLEGRTLPHEKARNIGRRERAFSVLPTISFDNTASEKETIIEVSGRDRQGLLYQLLNVLHASHLDIHAAYVSSYGARAVDVFYVHERGGKKLVHGGRKKAIGAKLRDVLDSDARGNETQPFVQTRTSERQ